MASNGNYIQIYVDKACFHHPNGFDQCSEYDQKGYASFAECDNGTPKYTVYSGSKSGNSNTTNSNNSNNTSNRTEPTENNTNNNNNNTTTTPQNDPTFDRNNASFQDYYKNATAAGQAGNYDEAIDLWNKAISVAVNDDQRNNARAWLAEAQKAKGNTDLQRQNDEQLRRQEQIRQNELQKENEIKQKDRETLVNAGVTLVNLGIELFGKHEKTSPKFNGDLIDFFKRNMRCPIETFEKVSFSVKLNINANGEVKKRPLSSYYTDYKGVGSKLFEEEIERVAKLSSGLWNPATYDGKPDEVGEYRFSISFNCLNESVTKKLSSTNSEKKTKEIEKEYIDYFTRYSNEIKYINSIYTEDSVMTNFNVFQIKIPIKNGITAKHSIISVDENQIKDFVSYSDKQPYETQRKSLFGVYIDRKVILKKLLISLKANNALYTRNETSFYVCNNIDDIKNLDFQPNLVFSDKEKIENLKIIKRKTSTNADRIEGKGQNLKHRYRFYDLLRLISENGIPNYSYDFSMYDSETEFLFYCKNSFENFKSIINLNDSKVSFEDRKMVIRIKN